MTNREVLARKSKCDSPAASGERWSEWHRLRQSNRKTLYSALSSEPEVDEFPVFVEAGNRPVRHDQDDQQRGKRRLPAGKADERENLFGPVLEMLRRTIIPQPLIGVRHRQ